MRRHPNKPHEVHSLNLLCRNQRVITRGNSGYETIEIFQGGNKEEVFCLKIKSSMHFEDNAHLRMKKISLTYNLLKLLVLDSPRGITSAVRLLFK